MKSTVGIKIDFRPQATGNISGFHFESLYNMSEPIRLYLSRLKILELLLYLDALPVGD